MPRERRANIGRRTRHASQQQVYSRNLREERKNIIRENDRLRHRVSTRRSLASYNRLAFQYDPTANYSDDENLDIGRMTTICRYCNTTVMMKIVERMPSDTHKFVIRADCTPTGEHVRRFNAPTVNDVAAIIVGDPTKSRDIVVQRRSNIMHRVNETHRLYDALQYPIIYWQGQDGYDITLKMVDPITSYVHCSS